MGTSIFNASRLTAAIAGALLTSACARVWVEPAPPPETAIRAKLAAASLQDAVVVDCQLPGSLRKLGAVRTYMTPGKLMRLPAVDCRNLGGDYVLADLSSGTLSLDRWMPLAERGDAEAQYYVARIYANGMSGVAQDYTKAASWYQRASDQSYKSATLELAYLYEQGFGVPQDRMRALNMMRGASGLGDDLDYASKIAVAQAEAAAQVAAMTEQLEDSNATIDELRGQLVKRQDSLARSRAELTRSEDAVLDLRAQLAAARNTATPAANPARVKELESTLAAKQQALTASQTRMATLEQDLASTRDQLSQNLASSQSSGAQLARLLAASQAETKSVRGQLAQTEQRLNGSQEELQDLRASYRQEVDKLTAQADELEKLRHSADGGAALLTSRQRDLDRQTLRVQALEAELAAAKRQQTGVASTGDSKLAAANAQNEKLRSSVAALQARFDEQTRLLQTQRADFVSLQSKSQADRAALTQSLTEKLRNSATALQEKQQRLASLESETATLQTQYKRLQDEALKARGERTNDIQGLQNALKMAQQRRSEDASELDRLRTDSAKERYELTQQREDLQRTLATGQQKSEREVARLNVMIQERQDVIQAKEKLIASLQKQLDDQPAVGGPGVFASTKTPAASPLMRGPDPEATKLLMMAQGSVHDSGRRYHALVIGNSNYAFMAPLATPINDARGVAEVLQRNYGFEVKTLYDATSDAIMRELYALGQTLTPNDNLLIYYAGHGDKGPSDSAYWLGTDADKVTKKGWIPLDYIRDQIKNMNARHVIVVADACFAGAMTHAKTLSVARDVSEKRFQLQWNRRARMVLTSGQNTPVTDGGGSRDHSLFATYFIQILRQNMILMSGEMLSYELSGRIVPEARKIGVEEQPTYATLADANHDFGEFFFVPVLPRVAALTMR